MDHSRSKKFTIFIFTVILITFTEFRFPYFLGWVASLARFHMNDSLPSERTKDQTTGTIDAPSRRPPPPMKLQLLH